MVTRKGGKVVTIPLAPRTARAIDLAIGERLEGPIFLTAEGRRLDRHGSARIVRRAASRAGIVKLASLGVRRGSKVATLLVRCSRGDDPGARPE